MALSTRVLSTVALAMLAGGSIAHAQREDSFRWYLGAQGGVFIFETPSQTSTSIPSAGIQALIIAKRTGLLISAEEGIGSNETSIFSDPTSATGTRSVVFDDIRRFSAVLMAFPVTGKVEPYLGVGVGLMHVVRPDVPGVFASPTEAADAIDEAEDRGSTGFGTGVAGLQFWLTRGVRGFVQYQITTSPSDSKLFTSSSHTIGAGLRFSLGSAREGPRGGGY